MQLLHCKPSVVLIHLAALLFTIGACASPEIIQRDYVEYDETASSLQWPPPPQKPRIHFIAAIESTSYEGTEGSFMKRALRHIFGEEKTPSGLLRPYGVFADNGRVYVTDPGSGKFHVFDRSRKKYFTVERKGEEFLISPIGITADEKGNIYVSDSVLKQILIYNKEGKYLRAIGSSDIFQRPTGIALVNEKLCVVDTHGHRVLVISKHDGSILFSIGKQGSEYGHFNYPTNIFVDREKLIYVTDSLNFRVQIFNPDGSYLASFGKTGDGSGNFSKPKGIAVDSEGHIYVADAHFDNVQIFDMNGNLLLVFGSSGSGEGQFTLPAGIYIDAADRVYVADSYNKRIQIFQYVKQGSEQIAK